MPSLPLAEIAAALLAAIATTGLLTLLLASWIGRRWAARLLREDTNSQALRLRRQELLLAHEFEACSALSALVRQFLPTFHFPAMDWERACNEIAYDFAKIDAALSDFLARHAAVLPEETLALIGECIGLSREHRFKITTPEVPPTANKAAATLYEKLWQAESKLLKVLPD
jgi:hypothetical protein